MKRLIRFEIDADLFKDPRDLKELALVMNGFVVVRCEMMWASHRFEYTALHEAAPVAELGQMIPMATVQFSTSDNRLDWVWKIDNKEFLRGFVVRDEEAVPA